MQKYIAKLLSKERYVFIPHLVNKDLHLKDIKTVTFKDSLSILNKEEEERTFSLKKAVTSAIKYISPKVNHLNKLMGEQIVSACMTIDFESLINPRDWRSIDICIDKTTMLITTVFGVNDWYQY